MKPLKHVEPVRINSYKHSEDEAKANTSRYQHSFRGFRVCLMAILWYFFTTVPPPLIKTVYELDKTNFDMAFYKISQLLTLCEYFKDFKYVRII